MSSRSFVRRVILSQVAFGLLMVSGASSAASLSYYLDQSNRAGLGDGPNYIQVTIADGLNGAIDFTVQLLAPLTSIAGSEFGMQSFGFNVVEGGLADASNVSGLPDGWWAKNGGPMAGVGFGFYDIKFVAERAARLDLLTFSIVGVDGDTPETYVDLASGNPRQGPSYFSAFVAGLDPSGCGEDCVKKGFFGGTTAVPLPATAWLFGAGLLAAASRARRRRG